VWVAALGVTMVRMKWTWMRSHQHPAAAAERPVQVSAIPCYLPAEGLPDGCFWPLCVDHGQHCSISAAVHRCMQASTIGDGERTSIDCNHLWPPSAWLLSCEVVHSGCGVLLLDGLSCVQALTTHACQGRTRLWPPRRSGRQSQRSSRRYGGRLTAQLTDLLSFTNQDGWTGVCAQLQMCSCGQAVCCCRGKLSDMHLGVLHMVASRHHITTDQPQAQHNSSKLCGCVAA
jgi:hypothetical protein